MLHVPFIARSPSKRDLGVWICWLYFGKMLELLRAFQSICKGGWGLFHFRKSSIPMGVSSQCLGEAGRAGHALGSSPAWKLSRWWICLSSVQTGHIRGLCGRDTHLSGGSRKSTSTVSHQKPTSACGHWPCQALNAC